MRERPAIRAFLGLELGAAAHQRAAELARALCRGAGGGRVRWVREESLHVTLRFLGSIDTPVIPELVRCVGEETRALVPFTLGLDGAAHAFPSPRRPRVIALGLDPTPAVEALARAVERGVVAAGFAPEPRPFRPHVTLGRVRRGPAPALPDVTAPVTQPDDAWEVVETVLFRSDTRGSGARYTPLERIPLGAPGAEDHP